MSPQDKLSQLRENFLTGLALKFLQVVSQDQILPSLLRGILLTQVTFAPGV